MWYRDRGFYRGIFKSFKRTFSRFILQYFVCIKYRVFAFSVFSSSIIYYTMNLDISFKGPGARKIVYAKFQFTEKTITVCKINRF